MAADAVLSVSNIAASAVSRSERVELVQTGSCCFLPRVARLEEA